MISHQNREEFYCSQNWVYRVQWSLSWANQIKKLFQKSARRQPVTWSTKRETRWVASSDFQLKLQLYQGLGCPRLTSSTLGSAESHLLFVCGFFCCSARTKYSGQKNLLRWKALQSQRPPSQWTWLQPPTHSLCTVIVAPSSPLVECVLVQHNMLWSATLFWSVTIQKCPLLTHQICHFNVFRSIWRICSL